MYMYIVYIIPGALHKIHAKVIFIYHIHTYITLYIHVIIYIYMLKNFSKKLYVYEENILRSQRHTKMMFKVQIHAH